MATSTLKYAFDPNRGIATLTFNRPDSLNALDMAMAGAFREAVSHLTHQAGLRCVVLRGAGRAFMAGGDIASMAGGPGPARQTVTTLLNALNPAILELRQLDAPVIAGVHGVAAGAGFSIALLADIVVAAESARFLIGYNGIGAVPDCGGSWFLPNRIGAGRAAEMMILGHTLTAQQARDWGLVGTVAADDRFEEELDAMVTRAATGPGRAIGAFRRLTDQAHGISLADHLEAERQAFLGITDSDDFNEGVAAFLEKRTPRFQGR